MTTEDRSPEERFPALVNWRERTDEHMQSVTIMCVPPPTMDALLACAEALIGLYKDQMDYISINNLCGAENNHWMVAAREALAKAKAL